MKKQLSSFFLLLSLAFSISAQTAQVSKTDETEKNLRKHVEYLASHALEGRRTGEPGATTAAGYIVNAFAKLKLKPGVRMPNGKLNYMQTFPGKAALPDKPVSGYNVIGILEGRDKVLKNEAIVIGAHYDHLGRGGEGSLAPNSTEVHHGADDNASGTSAIIELARQFTKAKSNKRTIIFIAFSGEEEGLFGSKYYTNNPVFPIENTVAMFNLDMVGRLNNNKLSIGGIGTASEWKALVGSANGSSEAVSESDKKKQATILTNLSKIGINSINVSVVNDKVILTGSVASEKYAAAIQAVNTSGVTGVENKVLKAVGSVAVQGIPFTLQLTEDGFGPSDHASFYMKKVPVLFFFTGTHLDYHKPSDTAEKINYDGLSKIISYVASLVKAVDDNPAKPTYTVAKSSSTMGGRASFNITLGTIPGYTDSNDGMVIDGVRDDSPGSRAGLKANDKIVKLAGMPIQSVQDYMKAMGAMKADQEYDIDIVRGTEKMTLKITPVKRP